MRQDAHELPAELSGLPQTLAARLSEFCTRRNVDFEDKPKFSTERAAVTLQAFALVHGGEEESELLTDLLADLMHFADSRGINFDDELDTARGNYDAERE